MKALPHISKITCAGLLALGLLTGCSTTDSDNTKVSSSAYYGVGFYDPWYYNGDYYYPPEVIAPPPSGELGPHPEHPIARPPPGEMAPRPEQPIARPTPAPSIPSAPRPMPMPPAMRR